MLRCRSVPSILVYVEPERLPAAGTPWTIRRGELIPHELARPPDWALYIATVSNARVVLVGYLEELDVDHHELGLATRCFVDITPVIDRLGCERVDDFATWAATPIVLTKNDADLLRYRLGLPLDPIIPPLQPPAPEHQAPTGFINDETALRLLGLVFGDPASDAHRMVLADRLLELGDPRGELIALQLGRAQSGAPPTPRERELFARHGATWTQPLTDFLVDYRFRRGFLATTVVNDRVKLPAELERHSTWITVEDLETTSPALVLSSALPSLRRLATTCDVLVTLATQDRPLAIDTVVGVGVTIAHRTQGGRGLVAAIPRDAPPNIVGRRVQGGIELTIDSIQPLIETRVFEKVRAMSIAIGDVATNFLRTRLGARLQHIELFAAALETLDPAPWLEIYERNRPLSLGIRGTIDGWLAVIVRQRASITLQLGDPIVERAPNIQPLWQTLLGLGLGIDAFTLEHVGDDGIDLQPVLDQLRRGFRGGGKLVPKYVWRSP